MFERARALAADLLRQWNVAEPPVPDTFPELGVAVWVREAHLPAKCTAALFQEPPFGSVIWIEHDRPPSRRRYAVYHALGHILLHPSLPYCLAPPARNNPLEEEASQFAHEMLMPAAWLARDVADLGCQPERLAERYRVTPFRMSIRLQELGLEHASTPRYPTTRHPEGTRR